MVALRLPKSCLLRGADPIVACSTADQDARTRMIATLDARADATTPSQRIAMAKQSMRFTSVLAGITSSTKRQRPQR